MDLIQFVNKWLHLLSIIGVLGGIMFALLVLKPGLKPNEPDEDGESDGEAAGDSRLQWKRWGIAQAILWVVALATGFANYAFVSPTVVGRYHMLLGMKMTLAILMFVIALALAHPMPGLTNLVRPTKIKNSLLTILIVLGVIIVGISTYLNMGRIKRTLTKPEAISGVPVSPGFPLPGVPSP